MSLLKISSSFLLLFVVIIHIYTARACTQDKPVIIVGAGISGINAAREILIKQPDCHVIILEAREYIAGRLHTFRSQDGVLVHQGGNWIHGGDLNPLWLLNQQYNIVRTQWLPASYYIQSAEDSSKFITRVGNASYVPGADVRDDFGNYTEQKAHFQQFVQSIIDGSYSVPDVSILNYYADFIQERKLNQQSLDELYLFDLVYETLDDAWSLSQIGLTSFFTKLYGLDKEHLVAEPGYDAIVKFLAQNVTNFIQLNQTIKRIEYDQDGVKVINQLDQVFVGSRVLVTVPLGVLQNDVIEFVPSLPLWKRKAIHGLKMGLLDKIFLKFDHVFWPDEFDAFWRARINEESPNVTDITANEWYNIHSLNKHTPDEPTFGHHSIGTQQEEWPAVLLATPAGKYAEDLENCDDEQVLKVLMDELKTIFPNVTIPRPSSMYRTKWRQDKFAYGSYSIPLVGTDPLVYDYLAEPIADRVFFAGEHTSTDLRAGYADGAYISGHREAQRIVTSISQNQPYQSPVDQLSVQRLDEIRKLWVARISELRLVQQVVKQFQT